MAFSYLAIAIGAISSGWVSDKLQKRKIPIIIAGLVGIPTAWAIGQANDVFGLSILTALLWFCGGLGIGLIGILAGLSSAEHERGTIFGILSLTSRLGAIIGGLASGIIVDQWGFEYLFTTIAIFLLVWPISRTLLTEAKEEPSGIDIKLSAETSSLGKRFYLLFAASLLASIASFVIMLGRSLLMNELAFNATSISITGVIGGVFGMPLPVIMGWLSDRSGRLRYLHFVYFSSIMSLLILIFSKSLWHFATALALQSIAMGINTAIGNALITDLLPKKSLGRGLSLFGATSWIGAVLGFAAAGLSIQNLDIVPTFSISITLPVIAILILKNVPLE